MTRPTIPPGARVTERLPVPAGASRYSDRSTWGPGPWNDEPDKCEWRDERWPSFVLLAVRGTFGAWCGYVGVPPGHRDHSRDWYDVDGELRDGETPHGGLTYSAGCNPGGRICHVPEPGESDAVWWIGFDCAHYLDVQPGLRTHGRAFELCAGSSYRPLEYVVAETERLAAALAKR